MGELIAGGTGVLNERRLKVCRLGISRYGRRGQKCLSARATGGECVFARPSRAAQDASAVSD